jgi:signal transduction histidine kinase
VPVDRARAGEIVAVVAACLDNVVAHVGPDAPAWILLESDLREVRVSVRDDGPGIAAGRLDAAAREGRLGVSSSIRGRMAELGGRAELTTGPHGTEWELVVPR